MPTDRVSTSKHTVGTKKLTSIHFSSRHSTKQLLRKNPRDGKLRICCWYWVIKWSHQPPFDLRLYVCFKKMTPRILIGCSRHTLTQNFKTDEESTNGNSNVLDRDWSQIVTHLHAQSDRCSIAHLYTRAQEVICIFILLTLPSLWELPLLILRGPVATHACKRYGWWQ